MRYPTQKIALTYFAGAMALFLAQMLFGLLAGLVYVWPNFLSETAAVQHHPHDPYQRADRVAPARLLRRHLLSPARGGGARHREPAAGLCPVLDHLRGGAAVAVVGYLFRIHEGREFLEQPIYVKIALIIGIPDVPLQHQHDRAQGPQDGRHRGAADGPVGRRRLLPVRLLQPGQSRPGQDLLVVGGPHLGRGRMGADHGCDPRLPADQGHRASTAR